MYVTYVEYRHLSIENIHCCVLSKVYHQGIEPGSPREKPGTVTTTPTRLMAESNMQLHIVMLYFNTRGTVLNGYMYFGNEARFMKNKWVHE